MVDNHALALRGLVLDNAFTDIQKLVEHAVGVDRDVVYGVYVSADGRPEAYASPTLPRGEPKDFTKHWTELSLPADGWKSDRPSQRETNQFGQNVLEVSRPVIDQGEVLGASTRVQHPAAPGAAKGGRVEERAHDGPDVDHAGGFCSAPEDSSWPSALHPHHASPRKLETSGREHCLRKERRARPGTHADEIEVLAGAFNHMQQANEDAMTQ